MKRLKILIVVMLIFLIFLIGYHRWQSEETTKVWVTFPTAWAEFISTWDTVEKVEETVIYTWEDTENKLIEKVNELVGDESISRAIVQECVKQTEDYKLCIKNIIWVSNAESGMFKQGMKPSNNGFWLMKNWTKMKFSSVEEWIQYRVSLYVKNWWAKRATWAAWLKWNYCTSECSHWTKNYNSAIKKLSLD